MKGIINMITLKRPFLVLMFMLLLGCVAIQAADDLITQQITIKLDSAGTLPDRIGNNKKYKITNLKIIGKINGTDLRMIRDMAGCGFRGNETEGNLEILDLSEAKIVSGGTSYYDPSSTVERSFTASDCVGDNTFRGCGKLTSVTLPPDITSIGDYAFHRCTGLTDVTIQEGVESIGSYAFEGCTELSNITIPSSVTSIGSYAFQNCKGLTSISIPSGVADIEYATFSDCTGLTDVTIPEGVESIDIWAF